MRAIPPGMGGVRYGVTPCLSVREDDGRRHTKRLGGCYGHTKEEAEAKGRKAVSDWKQACGWAYGWTRRGGETSARRAGRRFRPVRPGGRGTPPPFAGARAGGGAAAAPT